MSILRYIRLGWTEIGKTLAAFITDTIEGAKVYAECSEMTGYYNGYRDGQVDVLRKMAAEAERDAAKCPDDCGDELCRTNNLITARWLRERANAIDHGIKP